MQATFIPKTVAQPFNPVKSDQLPDNVLEALKAEYGRAAPRKALAKLSQGEIDVLEDCRRELGWPTISSLAVKYYPLYPYHKLWARALSHCRLYKVRTATLNIKYLLLAVITQVRYSLEAQHSGGPPANRLQAIKDHFKGMRSNRLAQPGRDHAPGGPRSGPDKFANQRYAHLFVH